MDRLELAYEEFIEDVSRIQHLVKLVKALRDFGATKDKAIRQTNEATWNEALCLWREAKERRTDLPLLSGSLLMYLAGRFEYFVRQTIEVAADEMAGGVAEYEALPSKFREHLRRQTLEVARNPGRFGYNEISADVFLQDFAAVLKGDYEPSRVAATLLSLTESNLKSKIMTDLAKRIGMEGLWKDLGKQARLKLVLEKSSDGEATVEAQVRLDAIIEERNSLAHPTTSTTFPDPDKVLEAAKFLAALAEVLHDIVRVYLAGWNADSAT